MASLANPAPYLQRLVEDAGFSFVWNPRGALDEDTFRRMDKLLFYRDRNGAIEIVLGELRAVVDWRSKKVCVSNALQFGAWDRPGAGLFDRFCRGIHSLLLAINGRVVLHGNVLRAEKGRAGALLGASGVGKSTLTWAMAQRGLSILSDDVCALDPASNEIKHYSPFLQLRSSSASFFGMNSPSDFEKKLIPLDNPKEKYILEGICFIFPWERSQGSIEKVAFPKAVLWMMKHTIVDPRLWGVSVADYFSTCTKIARRIRFRMLQYQKRPESILQVAELVSGSEIFQPA